MFDIILTLIFLGILLTHPIRTNTHNQIVVFIAIIIVWIIYTIRNFLNNKK